MVKLRPNFIMMNDIPKFFPDKPLIGPPAPHQPKMLPADPPFTRGPAEQRPELPVPASAEFVRGTPKPDRRDEGAALPADTAAEAHPPEPTGPKEDLPKVGTMVSSLAMSNEVAADVAATPVSGASDAGQQPERGNREAWQSNSVEKNAPAGEGQFLPPIMISDSKAEELFPTSYERDFDRFVTKRNEAVESLAEEVQTLVPQVHETVRDGMQAAVDEGYVPADALDRLEPAFTQTTIQVVDQSELGDNLAVYEQSSDTLKMGADAVDYDPDQTIAHEIGGHKVSGGTFVTRENGTVERVRRGFVNHEEGVITSGRHYGLDEAVQQHLTLSYKHGQFDTVDPDARGDRDTTYYEHRKLLAGFVDQSNGVIDLKAITRGSFEDSNESGAVTTDRRAMVEQARAAYGPGAYRKLNLLFEAIDFEAMSADELAGRIHGPELGADGSIERRGSIDVGGLSFDFDDEGF